MEIKNLKKIEEILNFWFGEINNGLSDDSKKQIWYLANAETDKLISEKFGAVFDDATGQKLVSWQQSARSSLALVIILDQFSRNIHRGSNKAFASDSLALSYCLEGLELGFDQQMQLIEKVFYYHPLMHAESLEHQQRCVSLFETLLSECNEENRSYVQNSLTFAYEHRDIVAEFGRFPHRNKVLNRTSTQSELDFLARDARRYGQ